MSSGLLVRLRPMGPWRSGPASGERTQLGDLYHSDSLFSAVTQAFGQLGMMEEWLAATAEAAAPAVRFSSCFPWQGETLFVTPPRHLWPPQVSSNVRYKGACYVPTETVESLLGGTRLNEDDWEVDPQSRCLLPARRQHGSGPLRRSLRSFAPVDRVDGLSAAPYRTACVEFAPDAGLWLLVSFSGEEARTQWAGPVESALRLLADSGFGGKRSAGWGRSEMPLVTAGELPSLLMRIPEPIAPLANNSGAEEQDFVPVETETAYWLLSLFAPGDHDEIRWDRGNYTLLERSGRVESAAGSGGVKKSVRMVAEGSVLSSASAPAGSVRDVAPDGFAHPVYRYGFPVSIPIPLRVAS